MNSTPWNCAALTCVTLLSSCESMGDMGEHDWEEMPHHISVLVAETYEEKESAPSIGLDYEYRYSDFLGVGAVLEGAFDDIDTTTVLAVADLHITNQFIVQTGPGMEFLSGQDELVYRLGTLYECEWGGYTVSPQVHYDWNSGEDAIVVGIALGFGF